MNLFLGVYSPGKDIPNIWELANDYYLHNPAAAKGPVPRRPGSYSQWWTLPVYRSLPRAYEESMLVWLALVCVHVCACIYE